MDTLTKLGILGDAAKYDVSCSSSGSDRKNTKDGLGSGYKAGICHSWSDDGRCISLLKILLTNKCMYNCVYCVNRATNDIPRASFTPGEVIDLVMNFYRRNYIEGLFLSSAVEKSPDHTMEQMLEVVKKLRIEYKFNGYIHLKAIPGADMTLIAQSGLYVDRMSINIELPSSQGLKLLAPQKEKQSILKPMKYISSQIIEKSEERRLSRRAVPFVPAGQSTQLIVGATPDHDLNILTLSENLYKRFNLKRVFYSAYVPVSSNPLLPALKQPPLLREHRIYQADWLLRFYGFSANELLDETHQDFDMSLDPKCDWALRNIHLFPVEINRVDYEMLLRIPGIGVKSAQRIVRARRVCQLSYDDLKKIGVVLKRARYFITCRGKYYGGISLNQPAIRDCLLLGSNERIPRQDTWEQLSLFSNTFSLNTTSLTPVYNSAD